MFKYRIISFPLLLALLAAIVFWPTGGPWLFTAVATLMAAGVCFETAQMLGGMGMRTEPLSTAFEGGSLFCLFNLFWMLMMNCSDLFLDGGETGSRFRELLAVKFLAFPAILIFLGWFGLLLFSKKQLFLERRLLSLAVQVAVLFPLALLTAVYWKCGIVTFAALVLITKAMDTGGYIFGMLSARLLPGGNHKILPKISPKKSWEGTAGGVLFSVGVALLFWRWGNGGGFPLGWWIAAGIVLGLGSFAGDLTESALKRTAGVKDSGHIIPGMGGVFDVLDSFIYNGMLFWVLYAAAPAAA